MHYLTPAGFAQSFRKFFKFQVVKPLDVKTKFYNTENDEVYLEAQVNNFYIIYPHNNMRFIFRFRISQLEQFA